MAMMYVVVLSERCWLDTQRAYIAAFEEERELDADAGGRSGSTMFGTQEQTKREILSQISATLLSAAEINDKVGLPCFDQVEPFIPPKKKGSFTS
jgi:hypothetical protein